MHMIFNVFKATKSPSDIDACFSISVLDRVVAETFHETFPFSSLENCIVNGWTLRALCENDNIVELLRILMHCLLMSFQGMLSLRN